MNTKNIKGYPGYSISDTGVVVGTRNKPLKLLLTKWGYPYVRLRGQFKVVHRLVAQAFIPNLLNKEQVNHIDGSKTNNKVSNLEWCTRAENQLHAFSLGLQDTPKGDVGNKHKAVHSQYHNVGYEAKRNKWTARMSIHGKTVMGGRFNTEIEAARKINEMIDSFKLDRPKNIIK